MINGYQLGLKHTLVHRGEIYNFYRNARANDLPGLDPNNQAPRTILRQNNLTIVIVTMKTHQQRLDRSPAWGHLLTTFPVNMQSVPDYSLNKFSWAVSIAIPM